LEPKWCMDKSEANMESQDSSQPKLLWGKINLIVECDIEFEDGMEHEEFWDVYEALCVTLWSKYCAWIFRGSFIVFCFQCVGVCATFRCMVMMCN